MYEHLKEGAPGFIPPNSDTVSAYAETQGNYLYRPWMQRWESDLPPDGGGTGIAFVGGRILKHQGAVSRDLHAGLSLKTYTLGCALIALLSTVCYGAIVGSFSGGEQAAEAALKFPLVIIGSALICLPSFYVFQCLMGARLSLAQAVASVSVMAAACGLILAGCAPIAWFFSMSTQVEAWRFIALLHVAILFGAITFGMHFISRAHRYYRWKFPDAKLYDGRILTAWFALYLLVAVQMSYIVRPLMADGPLWTGERGIFTQSLADFFASDAPSDDTSEDDDARDAPVSPPPKRLA